MAKRVGLLIAMLTSPVVVPYVWWCEPAGFTLAEDYRLFLQTWATLWREG